MKAFGTKGVQITGFLGGLVNSTVTVTELAVRERESNGILQDETYRGVMLATCAMGGAQRGVARHRRHRRALRGAAAHPAHPDDQPPLGHAQPGKKAPGPESIPPQIPLRSPFSLASALKFGLIFLSLQIVGTLAQDTLGQAGFYAVASAAMLAAQGHATPKSQASRKTASSTCGSAARWERWSCAASPARSCKRRSRRRWPSTTSRCSARGSPISRGSASPARRGCLRRGDVTLGREGRAL